MRLLIFVWECEGHQESYLRCFVAALARSAEVVVAVPSALFARLSPSLDAELVDLGPSRPAAVPPAGRLGVDRSELDLLEDTIRRVRATQALHLFGDHLLPALVARRRLAAPLSLLLFRPRAHYRRLGSTLGARELAAGFAYERLLQRFRRRRDAHAVLTLDPVAAEGWSSRAGAPVYWIPEPWVEPVTIPDAARKGCVLYGYLSARKGVERLSRAVDLLEPGSRIVLIGEAAPGYKAELRIRIRAMRDAGARVERIGEVDEVGARGILASGELALLPYVRHVGMSRVLIEAAAAGTPVLADQFGLLGHLVERWDLGRTVATDDAEAFAAAIQRGGEGLRTSAQLRKTAERLAGRNAFERVLASAWGLDSGRARA